MQFCKSLLFKYARWRTCCVIVHNNTPQYHSNGQVGLYICQVSIQALLCTENAFEDMSTKNVNKGKRVAKIIMKSRFRNLRIFNIGFDLQPQKWVSFWSQSCWKQQNGIFWHCTHCKPTAKYVPYYCVKVRTTFPHFLILATSQKCIGKRLYLSLNKVHMLAVVQK